MMFSWLLLLRLLHVSLAADCYFRDGSPALIKHGTGSYVQCPGVDWCCRPTDTCSTNGLCRDVNNYPDGSNVTFSNGASANMTGLYRTPACVNSDFSGCVTQCTGASSSSFSFLWACNDGLTEYCCIGGHSQYDQKACCSDNATFELGSASTSSSTTSIVTSSKTSSPFNTTLTTTPSSTSTPTAAAPTSSTTKGSSDSLSEGTKIGIGVGLAVSVAIEKRRSREN
ncbi:hypothetical protein K431DRAFT_12009 [Polychaeton citri CBS 116435]|uniref:Uncharacterized protein n=1 Tax=Polychaeton citri CBS 116435 TaxID=1314669 RepID=A0A9P4UKC2_9PEZI|nr:hypothetical protein K431DRAFT_12009 [Polychaeton citri CBS 116435]